MPQNMRHSMSSSMGFILRSTLLHTLTYFVIGAASYWLVARRYWTGPEALPWLRNPEGEFVQRWFLLAQIVRGALHGVALLPLKGALLDMRRCGGLVVASLLLLIGTVAGTSGIIEDWVYSTTFHLRLFLAHLPEIVLQTLLYGYLLLAWERHLQKRRARGTDRVPTGGPDR